MSGAGGLQEGQQPAGTGEARHGRGRGFDSIGQFFGFRYQPVEAHETQAIGGAFGTKFAHPSPLSTPFA